MGRDGRSWKLFVVGACVLVSALCAIVWWGAWVGSEDPGTPQANSKVEPAEKTPRVKRQEIIEAGSSPLRPEPSSPAPTPSAEPTPSAAPVATDSDVLRIPVLGVAAPIQTLPITGTRTLVPPSDYTNVGLWPLGSQPGDPQGTSIIAGHTVHTGGGALDDLEHVSVGDDVIVERPGPDLAYRVASVKVYGKATLAKDTASIFSQIVPGRLAVVTCEDWNGSVYLSNVVVIAEPA